MGRDWIARGASMVTIAQDTGLLAEAALEALRQVHGRGGEAAPGSPRMW
jgi:4-hydroxy-2-oxoheptanedioate aldolase